MALTREQKLAYLRQALDCPGFIMDLPEALLSALWTEAKTYLVNKRRQEIDNEIAALTAERGLI